jgi:ribosomal protein S18 acetylase RimI-like enzyme
VRHRQSAQGETKNDQVALTAEALESGKKILSRCILDPSNISQIMTLQNEIALRPATSSDDQFLMRVFAGTRSDELAALAGTGMAENFVAMQFNIQRQNYQSAYPGAKNKIIVFRDQPVGRMLVDYTTDAIRLVDIALLEEFRRRGIGSLLLRGLIEQARNAGKPLQLSVYKFNPALRLYERLGFSKTGEDGLYIQMLWEDADAQG